MKRRIAIGILAGSFLFSAFMAFATPYIAASNLRNALVSQDEFALEDIVDFDSVREDLKTQVFSKYMEDRQITDSPLALAVVSSIGPALVDNFLNTHISAAGVAKNFRMERNGDYEVEFSHDGINRFIIEVTRELDSIPIVMERDGIMSAWRVVKIRVPFDDISMSQ